MKQLTAIALSLLFLCSYGQETAFIKKIEFKVIDYNYSDGMVSREEIKSIDPSSHSNDRADLYFFQKHFAVLPGHHLPAKFINTQYRSEKVTVSKGSPTRPETNRQYSVTYDSLSRVVNYTYSGCMYCSDLTYDYEVTYNEAGKVDMIIRCAPGPELYKVYYDAKGNIQQLEQYTFGRLTKRITRVH